ncbi:IS66 family insertion sequence element accessory protein TnpA [Citrobacter werkmanii]|uniref:IS66 family insertion sequence element accessory protein TnpA n=1 Tax=Citrobacter werkmanii TaxID=67827 RepID=UPI003AB31CBD
MQERKLYTLEEKRQHVASWRASGLTRQQYCGLHGIKFSTSREWPQDTKAARRGNDSGLITGVDWQ